MVGETGDWATGGGGCGSLLVRGFGLGVDASIGERVLCWGNTGDSGRGNLGLIGGATLELFLDGELSSSGCGGKSSGVTFLGASFGGILRFIGRTGSYRCEHRSSSVVESDGADFTRVNFE